MQVGEVGTDRKIEIYRTFVDTSAFSIVFGNTSNTPLAVAGYVAVGIVFCVLVGCAGMIIMSLVYNSKKSNTTGSRRANIRRSSTQQVNISQQTSINVGYALLENKAE